MKLFNLTITLTNGNVRTIENMSKKEVDYCLTKNAHKIASHTMIESCIISESMYNSIEKVNY